MKSELKIIHGKALCEKCRRFKSPIYIYKNHAYCRKHLPEEAKKILEEHERLQNEISRKKEYLERLKLIYGGLQRGEHPVAIMLTLAKRG